MNYYECVLAEQEPAAEELVRARRLMADFYADLKRIRRRREAARQLAAIANEREAGVQVQLLRNLLIASASDDLRKRAAKLEVERAEIHQRLQVASTDRELEEQEAHCAALSAAAGKFPPRERYAVALDRLDTLRQKQAFRSDGIEARDRARLAELRQALQQIVAQQLVPESLQWSRESKSNGMVV